MSELPEVNRLEELSVNETELGGKDVGFDVKAGMGQRK